MRQLASEIMVASFYYISMSIPPGYTVFSQGSNSGSQYVCVYACLSLSSILTMIHLRIIN